LDLIDVHEHLLAIRLKQTKILAIAPFILFKYGFDGEIRLALSSHLLNHKDNNLGLAYSQGNNPSVGLEKFNDHKG
jgi:hypothetical protein